MRFSQLLKLYDGDNDDGGRGVGERVVAGMDGIEYGYIDKDGKRVLEIVQRDFWLGYRLQSPDELRISRLGVCWDQVELERKLFEENGVVVQTVYVELEAGNSHTFVVYRDEVVVESKDLVWFEHSYGRVEGEHRGYGSIKEVVKDVVKEMRKDMSKEEVERGDGVKYVRVYEKPKFGVGCDEFMDWCRGGEKIDFEEELLDEGKGEEEYEMVHQEPDLKEFERIVKNWQLMTDEQKRLSDEKSIELFGKGNMDRVEEIRKVYEI